MKNVDAFRYSWVHVALLALLFSAPVILQQVHAQQKTTAKPHIVFIVLDDLGSHDLGIHGSGISTPATDRLGEFGVYLSNYFTLSSCTQTRIAFMTGRYPYASGIYDVIRPETTYGMNLDDESLAEVLNRAGYESHAVGKWHLGQAMYEQTPTFRGFSSFMGYYGPGQLDYFNHTTTEGDIAYALRYDKQEFCARGCSEVS